MVKEGLVRVRVIPNSKHSSIVKREDELRVKVTSSASKGKANRELLKILYSTFQTRDIDIIKGTKSRRKLIRIAADKDTLDRIIDGLPLAKI